MSAPKAGATAAVGEMTLLNYYRSSASFRVRIALALKGLPFHYEAVHLAKGEHRQGPLAHRLPHGLLPVLEVEGEALSQSLAIIEYLEETHPEPALLPGNALARAHLRAWAQDIACDTHPLHNLRVLRHLVDEMGQTEAQKLAWMHHWMGQGLGLIERRLQAQNSPMRFCLSDEAPTLVEVVLVPQVASAQRFGLPLEPYPRVMAVHAACMALPAFQQAQPSACPDAE